MQGLVDIVKVFAGEYMSFAVSSTGHIWAWGLNKNNCLLTNRPDMGFIKTFVDKPLEVILPDYFLTEKINVVQNSSLGFDFYVSQRPVMSQESKMQTELCKL